MGVLRHVKIVLMSWCNQILVNKDVLVHDLTILTLCLGALLFRSLSDDVLLTLLPWHTRIILKESGNCPWWRSGFEDKKKVYIPLTVKKTVQLITWADYSPTCIIDHPGHGEDFPWHGEDFPTLLPTPAFHAKPPPLTWHTLRWKCQIWWRFEL